MKLEKPTSIFIVLAIVGVLTLVYLNRSDFSEKGTLIFNGPGNAKAASLWKQYKEVDGTIQNKESKIGYPLVFDDFSQCIEGARTVPCKSMGSVPGLPFANKTVVVKGIRQDDNYSILVRKVIKQ